MLEEIDMPWDWPADVNFHEAKAFCNWLSAHTDKQIRLPSETEWYRLYDLNIANAQETDHTEWIKAPGNINLEYWASSSPVNAFMHGEFGDIIGNVWQWTETAIDGFNGFLISSQCKIEEIVTALSNTAFYKNEGVRNNSYNIFIEKYHAKNNYKLFLKKILSM